jgi:hypothetical protein
MEHKKRTKKTEFFFEFERDKNSLCIEYKITEPDIFVNIDRGVFQKASIHVEQSISEAFSLYLIISRVTEE